jgi:hypothetical protein
LDTIPSSRYIKKKEKVIKKIEIVYNGILKKYIKKKNLAYGINRSSIFRLAGDKRIYITRYEDEDVDIDFFTSIIEKRAHGWLTFKFTKFGKLEKVIYIASPLAQVKLTDLLEGYQCMKELSIMLV